MANKPLEEAFQELIPMAWPGGPLPPDQETALRMAFMGGASVVLLELSRGTIWDGDLRRLGVGRSLPPASQELAAMAREALAYYQAAKRGESS